jgi:hypothetical protein
MIAGAVSICMHGAAPSDGPLERLESSSGGVIHGESLLLLPAIQFCGGGVARMESQPVRLESVPSAVDDGVRRLVEAETEMPYLRKPLRFANAETLGLASLRRRACLVPFAGVDERRPTRAHKYPSSRGTSTLGDVATTTAAAAVLAAATVTEGNGVACPPSPREYRDTSTEVVMKPGREERESGGRKEGSTRTLWVEIIV